MAITLVLDFQAALWTAAIVGVAALYWFVWVKGRSGVEGMRAINLRMGSISSNKVQDNFREYWSFFNPKEIKDAAEVPAMVDKFYNLVTDIYELKWGVSFHFSPSIPGVSYLETVRIHEELAADLIAAKPGQTILDVGCGIGGPMRAIARQSGARIVGITINEYQVTRARAYNKKAGLDAQCEVKRVNFLEMSFEDASFDGAYAIEATCHAPRLEDVYAEVFRVLKPGALFVSYEWVTTKLYNSDDPVQAECIQGIERGDALPGLRTQAELAGIAKKVGFEVVDEKDLALPPAGPWWTRFKTKRTTDRINHLVLNVLTFLRITPKGVVDLHNMLLDTANHLVHGGETGIFTPMYMILCRKPLIS